MLLYVCCKVVQPAHLTSTCLNSRQMWISCGKQTSFQALPFLLSDCLLRNILAMAWLSLFILTTPNGLPAPHDVLHGPSSPHLYVSEIINVLDFINALPHSSLTCGRSRVFQTSHRWSWPVARQSLVSSIELSGRSDGAASVVTRGPGSSWGGLRGLGGVQEALPGDKSSKVNFTLTLC